MTWLHERPHEKGPWTISIRIWTAAVQLWTSNVWNLIFRMSFFLGWPMLFLVADILFLSVRDKHRSLRQPRICICLVGLTHYLHYFNPGDLCFHLKMRRYIWGLSIHVLLWGFFKPHRPIWMRACLGHKAERSNKFCGWILSSFLFWSVWQNIIHVHKNVRMYM